MNSHAGGPFLVVSALLLSVAALVAQDERPTPDAALAFCKKLSDRPEPSPAAADLKAMQGDWVFSAQLFNGNPMRFDRTWRVVIAGGNLKYMLGKATTAEYTLTLDPSKQPKRFTFQEVGGKVSISGIYRLDRDTLSICYELGDAGLPRSLNDIGQHTYLEVFTRKKP